MKTITNKLPIPTEHEEAVMLTQYLDLMQTQGKVKLYTHVANETFTRSWNTKRKNKQEGVMPGCPDYIILTPEDMFFIELKRIRGGVVSSEQKQWIEHLQYLGFNARVCKGSKEAIDFIEGKRTI